MQTEAKAMAARPFSRESWRRFAMSSLTPVECAKIVIREEACVSQKGAKGEFIVEVKIDVVPHCDEVCCDALISFPGFMLLLNHIKDEYGRLTAELGDLFVPDAFLDMKDICLFTKMLDGRPTINFLGDIDLCGADERVVHGHIQHIRDDGEIELWSFLPRNIANPGR